MCLTHSLFNGCVYEHLCVCFGGGGWGVMTGRIYDSTPVSLLISLTRTEQKGRICRQPYCIVCVFVFVCARSVFFISLRWMMMIGTCDSFDLVLTLSWCPQGNWDNLQKKIKNKKISCGRIKKHVCVCVQAVWTMQKQPYLTTHLCHLGSALLYANQNKTHLWPSNRSGFGLKLLEQLWISTFWFLFYHR